MQLMFNKSCKTKFYLLLLFILITYFNSSFIYANGKCDLVRGDFSGCKESGSHLGFFNKSVEFYKVSALWFNIYEELFFALSCNDDDGTQFRSIELLNQYSVNFLRITYSDFNEKIYEVLRRLGELSMMRPLPYHRTLDYETLLKLKEINLTLEVEGICKPKEERGSIYFDVYDPYFVERKTKLLRLLRNFKDMNQLNKDFPEVYNFLKSKAPIWLSEVFIRGVLALKGKDVERFTTDLFDIVQPYSRPFTQSMDKDRRLTALYEYLLDIIKKEPNDYIYYLEQLSKKLKYLSNGVDMWTITRGITRDKTKALRVLAMLSHNHLFEMYAIGRFANDFDKNGNRKGELIFDLIDKCYRTIRENSNVKNGKFYLILQEEKSGGLLATPDDFYHFFAAAFVGNELKIRRHPSIFINLAGEFIGYFYEAHNHWNQKGIDQKDVNLHKLGTEFVFDVD